MEAVTDMHGFGGAACDVLGGKPVKAAVRVGVATGCNWVGTAVGGVAFGPTGALVGGPVLAAIGTKAVDHISSTMNRTFVERLYCPRGHPMYKKIHNDDHHCGNCRRYLPRGQSNHSKCNGGSSCDHHLCSDCEGKQLGAVTKVAETTEYCCPSRHNLEMRVVLQKGCACNVCEGDIVAGNVRLRCKHSTCNYDVCMICLINYDWSTKRCLLYTSPSPRD